MVLHDKGSLLIDFIPLFFFSFSLSHPFFHPRKGTIMYTNRHSKNRKSLEKFKATGWECSKPSTWSECKGTARLHFPILCLIRSSAIPLKSLSPSSSRCCDLLSCRPAIPSADLYLQPSPHRHIYFNGADNLPFICNDVVTVWLRTGAERRAQVSWPSHLTARQTFVITATWKHFFKGAPTLLLKYSALNTTSTTVIKTTVTAATTTTRQGSLL